MTSLKSKGIIGLDMHPDVFAAAALVGSGAASAQVEWLHERVETAGLEHWARKHLGEGDLLVIEASGNTFEVVERLRALGHTTIILESAQAAKIAHNYCNDDRHSAVKLARVYLSGLAKEVWHPDAQTCQRWEVFFAHRNAVTDATRLKNRIRSFLSDHGVRLSSKHTLSRESTEGRVLKLREWSAIQAGLLCEYFQELRRVEQKRVRLEKLMVRELVGYFGLAPRQRQSGNDVKERTLGVGQQGRGDVRALLTQSAQNALNQKGSPLHKWGWKLLMKKERNVAVAAVARKLTMLVWYVLKGCYTRLEEMNQHLEMKLLKLATVLELEELKAMKFSNRAHFVQSQLNQIRQLSS